MSVDAHVVRQAAVGFGACALAVGLYAVRARMRKDLTATPVLLKDVVEVDGMQHPEQATGPGSEFGSETGRSTPFSPYDPFEHDTAAQIHEVIDAAAARQDEHYWMSVVERVALVHENLRATAADEAAAQVRLLSAEVRALEAALHESEARRVKEAKAWRHRVALLLLTGRLSIRPSGATHSK